MVISNCCQEPFLGCLISLIVCFLALDSASALELRAAQLAHNFKPWANGAAQNTHIAYPPQHNLLHRIWAVMDKSFIDIDALFRAFPWCSTAYLTVFACLCFCFGFRCARPNYEQDDDSDLKKTAIVKSKTSRKPHCSTDENSIGEQRSPSKSSEHEIRSPGSSSFCCAYGGTQCFSAANRKCSHLLLRAVRKGIARYDRYSIGVPVTISGASFHPRSGILELSNLVVANPEGYYSEYLLCARKVSIKVDMKKLIRSQANLIEIHSLQLSELDIMYEQGMQRSNIDYVMDFLEGVDIQEGGKLARSLHRAASTVGNTLNSTANFVAEGTRKIVRNVAPEPVRRTYSFTAGAVGDVLDDVIAVTGTTVAVGQIGVKGFAGQVSSGISDGASFFRRKTGDMYRGIRGRLLSTSTSATLSLEKPQVASDADDDWLIVHRASASDITVSLGSTIMHGSGVKLSIQDIDIEDVAESTRNEGTVVNIRFLLQSLLKTVRSGIAHDAALASRLGSGLADVRRHAADSIDAYLP